MSDHDNAHQFEKEFIDLVDATESRDAGIVEFELQMTKAQDALSKIHIGKKGVSDEEMERVDDELNAGWTYEGDIACVTGRIYLADPDVREFAPDAWGEPFEDELGRLFFYVDDARLRSHGVEAIPVYDVNTDTDDDSFTIGMGVGYVFSAETDEQEWPVFIAYPGELSRHEYERPTPTEAHARLQRQWPDQLEFIESLLNPDMQNTLPQRLALIGRRIHQDLVDIPQFRMLVEIYMNDYLDFDTLAPYIMTATKQLSCYDGGDDPLDPDDPGHWVPIEITEPVTLLSYSPRIHFTEDENGAMRAHIIAYTFNVEEGDDFEYISLSVDTLTGFRSSRAQMSLVSRALQGFEVDVSTVDPTSALLDTLEQPDTTIHVRLREQRPEPSEHIPAHIRQMEFLENELTIVAKEIRLQQRKSYATIQEAQEASAQCIRDFVTDRLVGAGIFDEVMLEFSGERALRPRVASDLPDVADKPHVAVHGIDPVTPLNLLQQGDSFRGILYGLHGFARELQVRDMEAPRYGIDPSLTVTISHATFPLLTYQDSNIVDDTIRTRAIIPLDGSVDITIVPLRTFRQQNAAMIKLTKQYGKHAPIVDRINRLKKKLHAENATTYVPISRPELLSNLDYDLRNLEARGDSMHVALAAVESLFVERNVQMKGDVFVKQSEVFVADSSIKDGELLAGRIVDVRDDVPGKGVVFMVQVEENEVKYLPIGSITQFIF